MAELTHDRIWRRFTPAQKLARFAVYLVIAAAIVASIRTVEVIPDHDHMLLVQAPQQVCAAILPWLGSFVGTAAVS